MSASSLGTDEAHEASFWLSSVCFSIRASVFIADSYASFGASPTPTLKELHGS